MERKRFDNGEAMFGIVWSRVNRRLLAVGITYLVLGFVVGMAGELAGMPWLRDFGVMNLGVGLTFNFFAFKDADRRGPGQDRADASPAETSIPSQGQDSHGL
jgi:hypothetical protein